MRFLDVLRDSKFPVAFQKSIARDVPKPIKVCGERVVLWKDRASIDRCPHRGARLSDGRIVEESIECPYHGWRFDRQGACAAMPQASQGAAIPARACALTMLDRVHHDGVVWVGPGEVHPEILQTMRWTEARDALVTDYALEAPYNYFLQIENLLDPAHVHFVHHGFQGKRARASSMRVEILEDTEDTLAARFDHQRAGTPPIVVRFYWPGVVDVSILDPPGNNVIRKNIVFVCPIDSGTCRVLFRDVCFKSTLMPPGMSLDMFPKDLTERSYDAVNRSVIREIMQQDVRVLAGQQANGIYAEGGTLPHFAMPTEADALIVRFRRILARKMKEGIKN
jgi:phenylpropionate dioxygenase-like ring-hydroxylating dioxygenase large terminal subunit